MADADQSYKIQVIFDLLQQGKIEEARGGLKQLGDTTEGFAVQTQKATAAVGENCGAARDASLIYKELGKVIPGLGETMEAAFSGPLAPLVLLSMGVSAANDKLQEFNSILDQQGDWNSQPLVDKWKQIQTAISDAKLEIGNFHAALAAAGQQKDPIGDLFENQKKLADAELDTTKKLIEAEFKLEEERLRAAAAASPQLQARLDSDLEQLGTRKIQAFAGLDIAKDRGDLQREENEQFYRQVAQRKLDQNATATAGPAAASREKLTGARDEIAAYEKDWGPHGEKTAALQKARDALEKNQAHIAQYQKYSQLDPTGFWSAAAGYYELKTPALSQNYNNLSNQQSVEKQRYEDNQRHLEELSETAESSRLAHDNAVSAATENKARLAEINRNLPTDIALNDIKKQGTTATAGIDIQTEQETERGKISGDLDRDITDIENYANTRHPTHAMKAAATAALDGIIQAAKDHNDAVLQKFAEFHTTLGELKRQVNQLGKSP